MQARPAANEDRAEHVFDRIRMFLVRHRLSPDPLHYSFAHTVVMDPDGALARSVAALTDGGVRLSARDIVTLGGQIGALAVPELDATPSASADGLVAQTQMQVEGFTDIMRAIQAETQDFGRDLAASADAVRATGSAGDVARLTGLMLERVQSAESRLAAATREAMDLRAKLEEARDNARRDPLTGLPNRRAFEEAFADLVAQGLSACVAVCDVDRFKRVNDTFGHSVGDRVLKAIGDSLAATCEGQLVARYGGEEFTILFTGVTLDAALATVDFAREAVAARRFRVRESDAPLGAVTFSAGLTCAKPGEALSTVFARADKRLYDAKEDGRNKVLTA